MKKIFFISAFSFLSLLIGAHQALATQPIVGADIIIKPAGCNVCQTGLDINDFKYITTNTDGIFKATNLKVGKQYSVYYGNESLPPIATITTTDGTIHGKILVDIYGSDTAKTPFVYGSWNTEKTNALKALFIKEGVLTQTTALNTLAIKDLSSAIKAFQKKYKIDQTGQLGPKTVMKLNEVNK